MKQLLGNMLVRENILAREKKAAALKPPHAVRIRRGMNTQHAGSLYEFKDVDRSVDPTSYIDYLDQSNTNERMRLAKRHFISFLKPQKGHALLDIGCGVGHDVHMLADLVGQTGLVVGIDKSQVMIEEAKRRFRRTAAPVEFHAYDAHKLQFDQDCFDGVVCFSVLTHCEEPAAVLSEVKRVLKPGGRFIALEPDWETLVLSTNDQHSDDILTRVLRSSVRHSGIAHQLPTLFTRLGYQYVAAEASPLTTSDFALANRAWRIDSNILHAAETGRVDPAEARQLLRKLRRHGSHFFGAFMVLAVTGIKARRDVSRATVQRKG